MKLRVEKVVGDGGLYESGRQKWVSGGVEVVSEEQLGGEPYQALGIQPTPALFLGEGLKSWLGRSWDSMHFLLV